MEGQALPEELRSNIRYFAFFVGNGSLLDELDYEEHLTNSAAFGQTFAVYLNNLQAALSDEYASQRARQWVLSYCDPRYRTHSPFDPQELALQDERNDTFNAIKSFAQTLGIGALTPELLSHTNYTQSFFEGGSLLEALFAIFTNVLRVDELDCPINTEAASWRVAQYIRHYLDPSYVVSPPFEAWEIELV